MENNQKINNNDDDLVIIINHINNSRSKTLINYKLKERRVVDVKVVNDIFPKYGFFYDLMEICTNQLHAYEEYTIEDFNVFVDTLYAKLEEVAKIYKAEVQSHYNI